jgi:hypothetical protein
MLPACSHCAHCSHCSHCSQAHPRSQGRCHKSRRNHAATMRRQPRQHWRGSGGVDTGRGRNRRLRRPQPLRHSARAGPDGRLPVRFVHALTPEHAGHDVYVWSWVVRCVSVWSWGTYHIAASPPITRAVCSGDAPAGTGSKSYMASQDAQLELVAGERLGTHARYLFVGCCVRTRHESHKSSATPPLRPTTYQGSETETMARKPCSITLCTVGASFHT